MEFSSPIYAVTQSFLIPTHHMQYYRRDIDYFTPRSPHTVLQESLTILYPTGHTMYYRRASDYFTPYRPHSTTGEPVAILNATATHSTTGEPVTVLHPTGHTVLQESQ